MPSRPQSRFVAPALVFAGAALFAAGAAGLPRIDIDQAAQQRSTPQQQLVRIDATSHRHCDDSSRQQRPWT